MSGRYEVLDTFTVNTPSLSVVIRADDTPLPSNVKAQPDPANLVTVHAVEGKDSAAPRSGKTATEAHARSCKKAGSSIGCVTG